MPGGEIFGRALALFQSGHLDAAEALFGQVLAGQPEHPDVLHYLGVCSYRRGDPAAAARHLAAARRADPNSPFVHNSLGLALKRLQRLDEALAAFDRAIELAPATAAFFNNRGLVHVERRRPKAALADFERAVTLQPDFAGAYNNLGKTLTGLGHVDAAHAALRRAIELSPDFAEAHANLAALYRELGRFDAAAAACERALALDPDFPYLAGYRLHDLLQGCAWDDLERARSAVIERLDDGGRAANPFVLLAVATTPAQQQCCARLYALDKYPPHPEPLWRGERYGHARLRIGYFSADYYNHATAHLLAGLIERHDRARFEVIGFYFGPDKRDAWRRRLEKAFDRFIDMTEGTDADIAAAARHMEIDIAVDLKGYTQDARPGIFARRPAPIQVNYLGYPGTLGADYVDYLIADAVVIPPSQHGFYSERIAYLPHSYQVNDSTKAIADSVPTRIAHGLPEAGFVFCCFNNNYKISPDVFSVWMRLLQAVDGSVLWLFEGNALAAANLRREAARRGVAAERLIFAPRLELAQHLARHRLADLFLDTFHYNAHTTASDALWAGLPVLTCLGETFAGRVAASLLTALGLPELIAANPTEYERMALALATDPARLAALRQKLSWRRHSQPLFDTSLYTRHIEAVYAAMWQRHAAGLAPGTLGPPGT